MPIAAPNPAVTVLRAAPTWCIGRAGNTALLVVRGKVDEEYVLAAEATLRAAPPPASRQATMLVLTSRASPPPDAVRARVVAALRKLPQHVALAAVVVEGEGFQVSLTRSVASGVLLLARPPLPTKIFSSVADAGAWIQRELPPGSGCLAPAALLTAVDTLRTAPAASASAASAT